MRLNFSDAGRTFRISSACIFNFASSSLVTRKCSQGNNLRKAASHRTRKCQSANADRARAFGLLRTSGRVLTNERTNEETQPITIHPGGGNCRPAHPQDKINVNLTYVDDILCSPVKPLSDKYRHVSIYKLIRVLYKLVALR